MNERRDGSGRRIELNQPAVLTNSDGLKIEVMFKDLSAGGFRISHRGEDLVVGEPVALTSARGAKATGQIKWTTEAEAGGVFLDLPEDLD